MQTNLIYQVFLINFLLETYVLTEKSGHHIAGLLEGDLYQSAFVRNRIGSAKIEDLQALRSTPNFFVYASSFAKEAHQ